MTKSVEILIDCFLLTVQLQILDFQISVYIFYTSKRKTKREMKDTRGTFKLINLKSTDNAMAEKEKKTTTEKQ